MDNKLLICSVLFLPVLLIACLVVAHFRKKLILKRWMSSLNLRKHQTQFNELYQNTDGFTLSKNARTQSDAFEYTYGEIEFLSFSALLSLVHPDEECVFYDLGSGIGKAVIASALVYPVKKSIGVELFPQLHHAASTAAKILATVPDYSTQAQSITFILGDFLEVDIRDATLIFINSTSLMGSTWEHLCARLDKLPHLKTVITTSKPLLSRVFAVSTTTRAQMSWGVVQVFIHVQKTNKY